MGVRGVGMGRPGAAESPGEKGTCAMAVVRQCRQADRLRRLHMRHSVPQATQQRPRLCIKTPKKPAGSVQNFPAAAHAATLVGPPLRGSSGGSPQSQPPATGPGWRRQTPALAATRRRLACVDILLQKPQHSHTQTTPLSSIRASMQSRHSFGVSIAGRELSLLSGHRLKSSQLRQGWHRLARCRRKNSEHLELVSIQGRCC